MGLDANFPNPNDKITKKVALYFARNSAKRDGKSEKSAKAGQSENNTGDFLTVLRETEDGYVVRITKTNKETGEKTGRTEFIARELFESGVKTGYLRKIDKEEADR